MEQVTYLMFLKLDEERAEDGQPSLVPAACRWATLADLTGAALARAYEEVLKTLGAQPGLVGAVFARATNRIEEPAFLNRLVRLIAAEDWFRYGNDVKGAIYEGLLERTASDVKSGAGQYFTPRPLIQAIVEVVDPQPGVSSSATRPAAPAASCSPPVTTCAPTPPHATAIPPAGCGATASPDVTSSPASPGWRR